MTDMVTVTSVSTLVEPTTYTSLLVSTQIVDEVRYSILANKI